MLARDEKQSAGAESGSGRLARAFALPSPRRLFALLSGGAVLVAASLAISLWLEGHGGRPASLARELERTQAVITGLAAENEAMAAEIEALRGDRRAKENAARKLLGVVADREIVVFLEPESSR